MCVEENDIPFNLNREYVEKYVVNRGERERIKDIPKTQAQREDQRQSDRETERQRDRETQRQRDRETVRQ